MFFLFKRPAAQRHHHILNDGTCRIENSAVIGRKQQHRHQQQKHTENSRRQLFAQNHRSHHLIVKCTELLERRAVFSPDSRFLIFGKFRRRCSYLAFGISGQRVANRFKIGGIGIVLTGIFSLRKRDRQSFYCTHGFFAYRRVFNKFS